MLAVINKMRGSLCGKRTSTLTAINCINKMHGRLLVVDRTPTVIDPIARYSSRIANFAYQSQHVSSSSSVSWYTKL